jgi:hypothetical protein
MRRPVNALIVLYSLAYMRLLPFSARESLRCDVGQVCQILCLAVTAHWRRGSVEQVHITTEQESEER